MDTNSAAEPTLKAADAEVSLIPWINARAAHVANYLLPDAVLHHIPFPDVDRIDTAIIAGWSKTKFDATGEWEACLAFVRSVLLRKNTSIRRALAPS